MRTGHRRKLQLAVAALVILLARAAVAEPLQTVWGGSLITVQ